MLPCCPSNTLGKLPPAGLCLEYSSLWYGLFPDLFSLLKCHLFIESLITLFKLITLIDTANLLSYIISIALSHHITYYFLKILFIYLTERYTVREGTQAGRGGEGEAGFPSSREPNAGIDSRTLGS